MLLVWIEDTNDLTIILLPIEKLKKYLEIGFDYFLSCFALEIVKRIHFLREWHLCHSINEVKFLPQYIYFKASPYMLPSFSQVEITGRRDK